MEESHYTKNLIKVPQVYQCKFCGKNTGKREYHHVSNATVLGCLSACFVFPVCACGLCCSEMFQERKEYCLNCNMVIET